MKKNKRNKDKTGTKTIPQQKQNFQYSIPPKLAFFVVGIITFIVFYPSVSNDFVNWDDPSYVVENMRIQHFDFAGFLEMFNPFPKDYLAHNYHPLTELSLAIDFMVHGLAPRGYHFTNILIHALNTSLVFAFIFQLTKGRVIAALLTAILFGIHPMHVESVTWISERKDVLYVLFYLLAMLSYLMYLQSGIKSKKWIAITLLFFICSLLSKAQAVTLPMVLILMDYFYNRTDIKRAAIEKIPFFLLSLILGVLAIKAQTVAITIIDVPWIYRPFTASYALFSYLWMLIMPLGLSILHPYPFGTNEVPPFYIFSSVVVMIGYLGGVVMAWHKGKKELVFGMVFFFVTVLPVLQFLTVGRSIMAERYSYLPYIGLFFILGYLMDITFTTYEWMRYKTPVVVISIIAIVFFIGVTRNRISVWENSVSLWENMIGQYPDNTLPYLNLSIHYIDNNNLDKGIAYVERGLKIDPEHQKLRVNKAVWLMRKKQYNKAITVLEGILEDYPDHFNIYYNLGMCYENVGDHENSLTYYNQTLEHEPNHFGAMLQRGVIYSNIKDDQPKAIADFERIIEYAPTDHIALANITVSCYKNKQYDEALEYANRSVKLQPRNGQYVYVRSLILQAMGQNENAINDRNRAQRLGYPQN